MNRFIPELKEKYGNVNNVFATYDEFIADYGPYFEEDEDFVIGSFWLEHGCTLMEIADNNMWCETVLIAEMSAVICDNIMKLQGE